MPEFQAIYGHIYANMRNTENSGIGILVYTYKHTTPKLNSSSENCIYILYNRHKKAIQKSYRLFD